MRNWKRRANLGYAEARKQSRQEVMHLFKGGTRQSRLRVKRPEEED